MKAFQTLMVVVLILLMTFLFVPLVSAQGHGGGHGGSHGGGSWSHHGGHAHSHGYYGGYGYGWWGYPYWGYPYWWGYPYGWGYPYYSYYNPYYDPYYYEDYGSPPVPPQEATPPAETGQQQPSYWRFCKDPEGYYPYVKDCPEGWMTVVPPKPNATPPPKLSAPVLPIVPPSKKPE